MATNLKRLMDLKKTHTLLGLLGLLIFLPIFLFGSPVSAFDTDTNRLAHEMSPYLLQHAQNPVDWYPWGEEAFEQAKKQDKPIFLSIGYATCHWCHVMAHESFEDPEVAALLNRYFVAIKVDREERPDVDKIYMAVCQTMTGHGGWPLSIFMTPEAKPFFAGTYFPRSSRMGMPGFVEILQKIAAMWEDDRARIMGSGNAIAHAIQSKPDSHSASPLAVENILKKGYGQLARSFDPGRGGFGDAPKFPTPHNLTFLLRWHKRTGDATALEMVVKTLEAMSHGGIFDHIGFGFHRYSVDSKWLVPHFEKMLYDQAMLAMAYTEAFQITGEDQFAGVAKKVFSYVLRDMTAPEGGYFSAEDADSEGREGLFYVWTPEEVKRHLGKEQGGPFCQFYDITDTGNFEDGRSIIHVRMTYERFAANKGLDANKLANLLKNGRETLFRIRKKRIPPLKDDKILTSWNGLMIAAFSKGYQVFGKKAYLDSARKAAGFVLKNLKADDGRLLRRFRKGHAAYPAYLDDYAFLVWGLLELYEGTFDVSYLEDALNLNDDMMDLFWDKRDGGFYFTGAGNEKLITRSKEIYDGAIPSGNSVAAMNLLRLARLTGNVDLEKRAEQLARAFGSDVESRPMAFTHFLGALDFMLGPGQEIVISGDPSLEVTRRMISAVQSKFLPNMVLLLRPPGPDGERLARLAPFVAPMVPKENQPTAYVCQQYACKTPITQIDQLNAVLES